MYFADQMKGFVAKIPEQIDSETFRFVELTIKVFEPIMLDTGY